ncbi:proline-rich protein 5-like [Ischnura elegans]|uniref:proline-rich protein 5-like n=1 Tax=Ischnura elegans TaxID=197161 RepID=UPI001ED88D4F|nr:proline-rich protein 5-like [Ischnura elegans]
MPLNFRLSRKGGEGPSSDVVETRPKEPLALKRTPTFATLLRKEVLGLRSFDPMFRYSLTRLPEEEGGSAEARNQAGPGEGRCGAHWANIRDAVDRVVQQFCRGKPAHSGANGHCTGGGGVSPLADGELSALHSDLRVLLWTEAGAFIFEYLKAKLLPVTAAKVLEETRKRSAVDPADEAKGAVDPRKLCSELSATWEHFYSHSLTLLEAIIYQVKSRNLGIRQAGLLIFRDHIVLPMKAQLEMLLDGCIQLEKHIKAQKTKCLLLSSRC